MVGINAQALREQYCALFRHILLTHHKVDTTSEAPTVEIACKPFLKSGAFVLEITPRDNTTYMDDDRWALAAHAVKSITKDMTDTYGGQLLVEDFKKDYMGIRFHPVLMHHALAHHVMKTGDESGISGRHLYIISAINERMHNLIEHGTEPQFNN